MIQIIYVYGLHYFFRRHLIIAAEEYDATKA